MEKLANDLLKENTGASFLESGSAYGKHQQQNQDRNFEDEPSAEADLYDGEKIIPYVNFYHWLLEMF